MTYTVYALTSCAVKRVWKGDRTVIKYGPYKRLRNAKRQRAKMNKERILTIVEFPDGWRKGEDGEWISEDRGPWFTRVWIEVTP